MPVFLNKVGPTVALLIHERARQDRLHPDTTSYENGTGPVHAMEAAEFRILCDVATEAGTCTWADVLLEEVFEALAEDDPRKLRDELVHAGAVCMRWIETLNAQLEEAAEEDVDFAGAAAFFSEHADG